MQYSNKGNLKPKLVVLLTGVNNFGHINETPSQVFDGIKAVIKTLRENYPKAKILINGVFPFEESANSSKTCAGKKSKFVGCQTRRPRACIRKDFGTLFCNLTAAFQKELWVIFFTQLPKATKFGQTPCSPIFKNE